MHFCANASVQSSLGVDARGQGEFLFHRQPYSLTLNLQLTGLDSARQACQQNPGIFSSSLYHIPSSARVTDAPDFSLGPTCPKSSPHGYTASNSPTELSPRHFLSFYLSFFSSCFFLFFFLLFIFKSSNVNRLSRTKCF